MCSVRITIQGGKRMKHLFAILATLAAGLVLFDSVYKFFLRNTKKYIRDDSFQL